MPKPKKTNTHGKGKPTFEWRAFANDASAHDEAFPFPPDTNHEARCDLYIDLSDRLFGLKVRHYGGAAPKLELKVRKGTDIVSYGREIEKWKKFDLGPYASNTHEQDETKPAVDMSHIRELVSSAFEDACAERRSHQMSFFQRVLQLIDDIEDAPLCSVVKKRKQARHPHATDVKYEKTEYNAYLDTAGVVTRHTGVTFAVESGKKESLRTALDMMSLPGTNANSIELGYPEWVKFQCPVE